MRSVQVAIFSEHAFVQQAGMFPSPQMMPSVAPSVPAVQSVSSPQLTARQMLLPKSPSPHSQPMRMLPLVAGAA